MFKKLMSVIFSLLVIFGFSHSSISFADEVEETEGKIEVTGSTKSMFEGKAHFDLNMENFFDDENSWVSENDDGNYYLNVEDESHPIEEEQAEEYYELQDEHGYKDDVPSEGMKLPKTATNMFNNLGLGLLLIVSGVLGIWFITRKNKKTKNQESV